MMPRSGILVPELWRGAMMTGISFRIFGAFALFCCLAAPPALAQQVPQGSYLKSCREVQVRFGRDLAAFCATRQGTWVVTRLDNFAACAGDISNEDGQLSCEGAIAPGSIYGSPAPAPPPAYGERPPFGSYMNSCRDIRLEAGWLKATCRDQWGNWRPASTALSWCDRGADIANDNGSLTCRRSGGGGFASERPPYGSYMASCKDVRMVAGWLKASCRDRNGRWVDATTATGWCSAGRDIANDDGRLTCR